MADVPPYQYDSYKQALSTYRAWGLTKDNAHGQFWKSVFSKFHRFGEAQQAALETLANEVGLDLPALIKDAGPDPIDISSNTTSNPNWPSKTGKHSGKGRGNNAPGTRD